MDGALGTELERRGVPIEGSGWSAIAVRDYGQVVQQIHQDYIRAGAQLHIVNSFALARHVLEPLGLGAEFNRLNRSAVTLFDQAVANVGGERDEFWVAGSLSTFAANSDRSTLPKGRELLENVHNQAQVLFDAGVDLFALEMLFDSEVSLAMLNAVEDFKLPVILGFTCDWDRRGDGEVAVAREMGVQAPSLDEILPAVIDAMDCRNVILSIMHSEADVTHAALEKLKQYWDGPVAIYPNSGKFVNLQMQFDSVCSPAEFQESATKWIENGVQIVGGCCGIGPEHIRILSDGAKPNTI